MADRIESLSNAQDLSKIISIFSHGKTSDELKPAASTKPLFVILVGAPGAGKTSQAKKILQSRGMDYDHFYQVSLDSIVENVIPYRNATKTLFDTFSESGAKNLTDEELAMLSEVYLATIMSKNKGFNLNYTVRRITKKHRGNENKLKKPVTKNKSLATLVDLRSEALEHGIKQGYNILYDTTFRKSKNIMASDILPLLEMYPEHEYQIDVILVKAPKEQIRMQLNKRHRNMISQDYIRAISPKLIKMFIEDNEQGFEIAKEYFTGEDYLKNEPESPYVSDRFTFETIDNKYVQFNTTKKNKNTNDLSNMLVTLQLNNKKNNKKNNTNKNTNNLTGKMNQLMLK